jgi:putative transposase
LNSGVFDQWAYDHHVRLQFIEPGKPIQNAFIESFNSRFREECLNEHVFVSLDDARRKIEQWRERYNCEWPHSSLGYLSPEEFASANRPIGSEPPARTAWPAKGMLAGALQGTTVSNSESHSFSSQPQDR